MATKTKKKRSSRKSPKSDNVEVESRSPEDSNVRSNVRSNVQNFINKESRELAEEMSDVDSMSDSMFPEDGEFEPGEERPERRSALADRIDYEEGVIDELLASVPKGQGYYLKLYKMLPNNEPELKLRIDNWQNWSDLEYEVTSLVREMTKNFGAMKWGSGRYRILPMREGGIRGPKMKPIDFYVDAQETEAQKVEVPGTHGPSASDQLINFTDVMKTFKEINPTPNPDEAQKHMADAFAKGVELTAKKESDNGNAIATMMSGMTQMMTAMMTGMMTVMSQRPTAPASTLNPVDPAESFQKMLATLSTLGVLKGESATKSPMTAIKELQEMGLLTKPANEGTLAKLGEFKDLMGIVTDLAKTNKGETPTLMEKLVDVLAPRVPEMISNVTGAVQNAVELKKAQLLKAVPRSESHIPEGLPPATSDGLDPYAVGIPEGIQEGEEVPSVPPVQPTFSKEEGMLHLWPQYKAFFNEFYNKLTAYAPGVDHREDFMAIVARLEEVLPGVTEKISEGVLNGPEITKFITQYGDKRFRDLAVQPKLKAMVVDFIQWVRKPREFVAQCSKCPAIYDFESKEEFEQDPQVCGFLGADGSQCEGKLSLISEPGHTDVKTPEETASESKEVAGSYGLSEANDNNEGPSLKVVGVEDKEVDNKEVEGKEVVEETESPANI